MDLLFKYDMKYSMVLGNSGSLRGRCNAEHAIGNVGGIDNRSIRCTAVEFASPHLVIYLLARFDRILDGPSLLKTKICA